MRVLVTGADGFIGGHVLERLLASGHEVLAVALGETEVSSGFKSVKWFFGDISNTSEIKKHVISYDPEAMIHLAWEGIPDYGYDMSRRNIDISLGISNLVIDNSCCRKIISTGSCWEYGNRKGVCMESDAIAADSYFSWAKSSVNGYLGIKCKEHKIDFKWLRLFYVYGPGQKEKSIIPSIIRAFTEGRHPEIRNPANRNDYIYVKDVADAIFLALEKNTDNIIYNVGSGRSVPAYEVAGTIASEMKCVYEPGTGSGNGQHEDFWADTTRIHSDLGWKPEYSLEKGILETIRYFKKRCY
ncbi:MAG TPA: hypothetical protein DET40_17510 [Lentisphaeria bacterium]|nr:MAG: hypothetical protein A2X45_02495 [Lentisphaerae bacterium GWF2_50_93]HCE45340.1 hypothetical protein [Lentisphaeria bacterium]